MRFVDNSGLKAPEGWPEKVVTAQTAIAGGAKLDSFGDLWRCLKDALADISHEKCWYCEIKQERSDNAVDHFRPKSLYQWLAFSLENFRYACTFCNSIRRDNDTKITGGKGDYFPLEDESKRATTAGQEKLEQPLLINPCLADEPSLLDFTVDGRPTPRYPAHDVKKRRAETSIRLYHLDHSDLIEKRRLLAIYINQKIDEANDLFDRVDAGDMAINRSYNGHVRDLKNAIAEKAELSAFSKKIIMGRRDLPWVESLMLTN